MITCMFCKHWDPKGSTARFAECTNPKFVRGYGVEEDTLDRDQVILEDDEGWGMLTGRDFGCIHGEPVP